MRKRELSNHSLSKCTSKSIGLAKTVQNTDFNQMMTELQTMDEHVADGCVMYYTLYKYTLCKSYNSVLNKKSEWQVLLEAFESLQNEIQRNNLDFYKVIIENKMAPTVDNQSLPDDVVNYKVSF